MSVLKTELRFTETLLLPACQLNFKKRTRVYVYFYKQLASRQAGNKILGVMRRGQNRLWEKAYFLIKDPMMKPRRVVYGLG